MQVNCSEIDITPPVGVELSGFAARKQPSIGILDPLYVKALYLTDGLEKLLWLHCDLLELDREMVSRFRKWANQTYNLNAHQVTISATHTHSAPCTVRLKEAGNYDQNYVEFLMVQLQDATHKVMKETYNCRVVIVEGTASLAQDRRKTATSHIDPRVAGIGFLKDDDSFLSVIVNYPIHPVALGSSNRYISADIPGQVAVSLKRQLKGCPSILVTNGACANLNPPAENVSFDILKNWGHGIATAIAPLFERATPSVINRFRIRSHIVSLPLDSLSAEGIHAAADKALQNPKPIAEWGDTYRRAVQAWRTSLTKEAEAGRIQKLGEAELFGISINDAVLISLNGEVFSQFTDWIRKDSANRVYVVGYANGSIGYLPTRAAYTEGGYEVEVAHFFQGHFRVKPGGLEMLAQEALKMVAHLTPRTVV